MVNDEDREEEARRMTVDTAQELGGSVKLGKAFERVWKTTSSAEDVLSYFIGCGSRNQSFIHCLGALSSSIR